MNHGLDTDDLVCFYEQDFYVLSNFSSFTLQWKGLRFDTSEAVYHWEKFPNYPELQEEIRTAISAHEAFKLAQKRNNRRQPGWDSVKVKIMRDILLEKINQHEYVKKKLLETGNRTLVENSWRDDFWGWGPNKDGQNQLGKLWMELRSDINLGLSYNAIKWINNSSLKNPFGIQILKQYAASSEGRQQIAQSMINPFTQRINNIKSNYNNYFRSNEHTIRSLKNIIKELDGFLLTLPDNEKTLIFSLKILDLSKIALNLIDECNSRYEFNSNGHKENLASCSS